MKKFVALTMTAFAASFLSGCVSLPVSNYCDLYTTVWFQNPETPAMLVEKDRAAAEAVLENNKTYERICT